MILMNDSLHSFIDSFVTHVVETLKKNQLITNLKKRELRKEALIYLGHNIGGGELRVDQDMIGVPN